MRILDFVFSAAQDIIDSYFVITDLVDINLSDQEKLQSAILDDLANRTIEENEHKKPYNGKTVL